MSVGGLGFPVVITRKPFYVMACDNGVVRLLSSHDDGVDAYNQVLYLNACEAECGGKEEYFWVF